jgi:hypothetical protein
MREPRLRVRAAKLMCPASAIFLLPRADTGRGFLLPLPRLKNDPPDLLPRRVFFCLQPYDTAGFLLRAGFRRVGRSDMIPRENRHQIVMQLLHGRFIAALDAAASTDFSEQE